MYCHYTTLPFKTIVTNYLKNRELLALGVYHVLLAKLAILGELKLFLDLFLVPLGVVRDAAARRTFEFYHRILDLSHNSNLQTIYKAFSLYAKTVVPSTLNLHFPFFLSR